MEHKPFFTKINAGDEVVYTRAEWKDDTFGNEYYPSNEAEYEQAIKDGHETREEDA